MPWFSSDLDTYDIDFVYPLNVSIAWDGIITRFASTMEQRVSFQSVERYSYSGKTKHLTSSELSNLSALFISCQGQGIPMKWTYNSATRYVRFDMKALIMENVFTDYWVCDISLTDVHASEIIVDE